MTAGKRFSHRKIGDAVGIWDKLKDRWCDGPFTDRRLADNLLTHYNGVAHLEGKPGLPEDICPGIKGQQGATNTSAAA